MAAANSAYGLVKKLGALALVTLGFLGIAFGYEYESRWLTLTGMVVLVVSSGYLVLKIIPRDPG